MRPDRKTADGGEEQQLGHRSNRPPSQHPRALIGDCSSANNKKETYTDTRRHHCCFLELLLQYRAEIARDTPIWFHGNGVEMTFDVLTKDEAAERARISLRQLETQIRAGKGPAVTRTGGVTRVRSDELEVWLKRCTQSPVDDQVAA